MDCDIKKLDIVLNDLRQEIFELGDTIMECPEFGYKEFKTSAILERKFGELGLKITKSDGVTGFKATLDTGRKGPGLAVICELDAVFCSAHPKSNAETGAAHACGHNVQMSAVYAAAAALIKSGIADKLSGKIHFIGTPAEEYIDIEYRRELKRKGEIFYLGGKPELLRRGMFDDVDLAVMFHVMPDVKTFALSPSCNGFVVKSIRFVGKTAHAGGAPHEGINALYAATLALSAINSLRETFREDQHIRVHPVITKGGDSVTSIPSDVRIETFVRGGTIDDVVSVSGKVDRAIAGSAIAMGAKAVIENMTGYLPLHSDENLNSLAEKVMEDISGSKEISRLGHLSIASDLGDLSSLFPVVQAYTGGVSGGLHSAEYRITDPEVVYIKGARLLAGMTVELLGDGARLASDIINGYKPYFSSKEDYFKFMDEQNSVKTSRTDDIFE